eukprot:322176-Prymnesium_polylepis.1
MSAVNSVDFGGVRQEELIGRAVCETYGFGGTPQGERPPCSVRAVVIGHLNRNRRATGFNIASR